MSGAVFVIPCRQQEFTLVIDVKRILEMQNPDWPVERQCLATRINGKINEYCVTVNEPASKRQCVKPSKEEVRRDGVDSNAAFTPVLLQDHDSLGDCGLTNNSCLDLVVKEIEWRANDLKLLEEVMAGGPVADFSNTFNGNQFDAQSAAAVAYVLSVRSII